MNGDQKNSGGYLGAAMVGALAGATAAFLSSKSNREKLKRSVDQLIETGEEKMDEVKGRVDDLKNEGKKRLAQGLDKARNELESMDREVDNEVKKRTGTVKRVRNAANA